MAPGSCSVRPTELFRSTTFRWSLGISTALVGFVLAMFGFIYWQTSVYFFRTIDTAIGSELAGLRDKPAQEIPAALEENLAEEPWRIKLGGVFHANGDYRSGNIERLPHDLPLDGAPRTVRLIRIDSRGHGPHTARAVGRRLPSGEIVIVGQDIAELRELAEIVSRALALGLAPALGLAIALGIWLSLRAQQRIQQVSDQVERIVAGELRERLPTRGSNDPVDRLAVIVNRMLEQIEHLVRELAGVGNDIAHDLRRPLTRVRVILDRGREAGRSVGDFQDMTDRAVVGLDQALAIISALLRIAEIEHSARVSGFREIDLAGVLREVKEFYDPIAEDKAVSIALDLAAAAPVTGDRELLFEAVANLVDNSVKFTPRGGLVRLRLFSRHADTVVQVSDTGPGIPDAERAAVTKRFYRSDKSRNIPGVGLGLSLVSAILRLHRFELVISGRPPGCAIDIVCPR